MVADRVPLEDCARALVVKMRHHGDVLLAAPVLSALKSANPKLEVDALVYDDTAPMFEGHPALSQLFTVGRGWRNRPLPARLAPEWRLLSALRKRRYDLLVHLTEHPRGAWLARLLGPRYSVAPIIPRRGAFWRRSFTYYYPVVGFGRRHQVEINLDALRRIGIHPPSHERKVAFVPGADAEAKMRALVPYDGFIHMHPGSRWRFKCWPPEHNAQLIDRLAADGHRIVLTGAPDEVDIIERILARTTATPLNLAGKLTIKELGALIARARLFVGVDSMPMHVAAALGVPTIALFGPSGDREWGPWAVAHRVVTTTHSCRPCGLAGCGDGGISDCLVNLDVQQVYAAARELLG
ncbi:MAG: lipopolysaccharide heptosyltransferase [Burkholderiales bacterium]|nr:lipopolysaccharide heptosyltransferase [Burkholderiales bacterium]